MAEYSILDVVQDVDSRGVNTLTIPGVISLPYSICPDDRCRLYRPVSENGYQLITICDDIFDAKEFVAAHITEYGLHQDES